MLTSDPAASERYTRRTCWFVYGVWAVMTLQAVGYVIYYADPGPIVDEWEFVPALTDEEPFWPWLWKLHNEHRFPLPRLIYYALFKLTGDFRTGCFVSIAVVSLCALLMIATAKQLRGRLHFADAFFPISLLHVGHWENLRMGYQIVFMMNLVFAAILLRIILLTNRGNMLRSGLQAGLMTLLLLGCGASGLAYAPFMALWLLLLALWFRTDGDSSPQSPDDKLRWVRRALLVLLSALVPVYIAFYLHGYRRPHQHADPLEVWGSAPAAAWQAVRSAMQALSMSFGPAAVGLWPASAFVIGLVGLGGAALLLRILARNNAERPRAAGLLLNLGALALMALGIGWGRSVFLGDDNGPGFMGLSSRYGWIVWQALGTVYFMAILYGGRSWFRWAPPAIFLSAVAMLPFNIGTGIVVGNGEKEFNADWKNSICSGMSEDELVEQYCSNRPDDIKERMRIGVYLLRKNRVQYYQPVPRNRPASGRNPRSRDGEAPVHSEVAR